MVKYGKFLRANINKGWEKEYLDYKSLKKIIKEIQKNLVNSHTNSDAELGGPSINNSETIKETKVEDENMKYLKSFTTKLNEEIKKVYLFYVACERELYVSINSHLHLRQSFETFKLPEVEKELEELIRISLYTINLCNFINLNMTAIKKILKKFDKKFSYIFKNISVSFIKDATQGSNSNLIYILQFKMIDEVSALLEDLLSDLKVISNKFSAEIDNHNSNEGNQGESLLLGSNPDRIYEIFQKINVLSNNIVNIDNSNSSFRTNFKSWSTMLKDGLRISYNHISNMQKANTTLINTENESILTKFVNKNKIEYNNELSIENAYNIKISLFHTFFYMFIYSSTLSTNARFISKMDSDGIYSGVIMGMTPLAAIFSTIICSKWTIKTYKKPIIFSLFCFIFGNFFYAFSAYFESINMLGIGRLLIGFGSGRMVNRRYLIEFVPKCDLSKYSLSYIMYGAMGLSAGPAISLIFNLIEGEFVLFDVFIFNEYTNPSWLCMVLSILFLIYTFLFYTETRNNLDFNILQKNSISGVMPQEVKKMINEIDQKLDELNTSSNFSDTNLVAKNIDKLSKKEKTKFSYIYKCFLVLILTLFCLRITNESLIVGCLFYITRTYPEVTEVEISLFLMISFLTVVPFSFYFKSLSKMFEERRLIMYLLSLCLISTFFLTNVLIENMWIYFISFIFVTIFTNMLESNASSLFAKVIPSDYEIGVFNAGFIITISTTIGRTIGSYCLTFSGLISEDSINTLTYSFCTIFFFLIIILSYIFYGELRVKAIARIIKKKGMKKPKKSDFDN